MTTTFEVLSFEDMADAGPRSDAAIDAMTLPQLRAAAREDIRAVAGAAGVPVAKVEIRIRKLFKVKALREADLHDLRAMLREMRVWIGRPAVFRTPAPRSAKVSQPEGAGRMARPRVTKRAIEDTVCGLCTDPVAAGELIGRMRGTVAAPYEVTGWLCQHCLYQRRATPRRRDLLVRIFHDLFTGQGVGLNAPECALLLTWLTEDPAARDSAAWKGEPLDGTLTRLQMAVQEGKEETWLALATTHTIAALLQELPGRATEPADVDLLAAITQCRDEWTYPQHLEHTRFGTGAGHRRFLLDSTTRPTALSRCGGPFDLHQAVPTPEQNAAKTSEDASDDVDQAD